jgi:hypothetical protein
MDVSRHRILVLALAVSAAVHAAIFASALPGLDPLEAAPAEAAYTARLVQAAPVEPPAVAKRKPRPKPQRRVKPAPLIEPVAMLEPGVVPIEPVAMLEPLVAPIEPAGWVEPVVLAEPRAPDAFPVAGLPASVSIHYQLTSAVADGRAEYRWDREGDSYRIQGEAEADGFFALFLEGRILQESRGTVTAAGLRPDRFSEQRPNVAPEGLDFDWPARQVTFDRNGERKVSALEDNTVDWLSMIFQMAHVPPQAKDLDLQVFTQRKMYRFRLKVLGVEDIDIPLGRVPALHLRHEDTVKNEIVDVWLGIDQHFLPVKLRFPAARNRLVVDQVATRVLVR